MSTSSVLENVQLPAPYISCCISRHLAGSLFSNMYWNISLTAVAALSECRMGTSCRAQMAAYLLVKKGTG